MSALVQSFGEAFDGALAGLGHGATAWLATYLVHSTVLLLAAWLVARALASPRRREIVWRAALLGGIVTASAQVGLNVVPALGRYELGEGARVTAVAASDAGAYDAQLALPPTATVEDAAREVNAEGALLSTSTARVSAWLGALGRADLRHVGPTALTLGALFAFGSLAFGVAFLARRRRGQTRVSEGPLIQALEELGASSRGLARVELWRCDRSDTPYATGVVRRRIVVPERVATDLSRAEQRAMLAHELAHIERRDPLWLGVTRALQLFMPLQPLNALARRHLNACAELLCDERAVERTGDRLALAQSLAKVASWLVAEDALPDAACAMANHRSLLGARVARILDEGAARDTSVAPLRALTLVALCGTGLGAPAIALRLPAAPAEPRGAAAPLDASSDGWPTVGVDLAEAQARGGALPEEARGALLALAASLEGALAELTTELDALSAASQGRALAPETATRVATMEQRARDVRARAKRIRSLLSAAASRGVEAPRRERDRAAVPFATLPSAVGRGATHPDLEEPIR